MTTTIRLEVLTVLAAAMVTLAVPARAPADEGEAAREEPPAAGAKWQSLFDGKTLGKWKVVDQFDFEDHGKVRVADGRILIEKGSPASGIRFTGKVPKVNYEVSLEAMRVEGEDFFCGLSFKQGDAPMTMVVGGWGGSVVGLSSIDGEPAVENQTCQYIDFDKNRWYRIRLRVEPERIQAWIGDERVIDFATKDHKLTIYWEMEPCLPLGVATWHTTAALRNIRLRTLKSD